MKIIKNYQKTTDEKFNVWTIITTLNEAMLIVFTIVAVAILIYSFNHYN